MATLTSSPPPKGRVVEVAEPIILCTHTCRLKLQISLGLVC